MNVIFPDPSRAAILSMDLGVVDARARLLLKKKKWSQTEIEAFILTEGEGLNKKMPELPGPLCRALATISLLTENSSKEIQKRLVRAYAYEHSHTAAILNYTFSVITGVPIKAQYLAAAAPYLEQLAA